MSKTTIQLREETKEKLKELRLGHETNYDQTINRLAGDTNETDFTESEIREIVRDEIDLHERSNQQ